MQHLAAVEKRILESFGINFFSKFVPIKFQNSEIYTVTVESEDVKAKERDPIVLVHGFGAGVALWAASMKLLAKRHVVHAFDLLGFGRSSRPKFSCDGAEAEKQMVDALEEWRDAMEIERMYLVAHSFGGYLASAYAMRYPQRVKHLILADPWGFAERDENFENRFHWRTRMIVALVFKFNPLAILRLVGSRGPSMMKKVRPDLSEIYHSENPDDIYEYIYGCNSQNPTGEAAFKSMILPFAWAKRPMINRFDAIDESVPVTFIHGERSWIRSKPAEEIAQRRRGYVDLRIMNNSGHHVYADNTPYFVDCVEDAIFQRRFRDSFVIGNPVYA